MTERTIAVPELAVSVIPIRWGAGQQAEVFVQHRAPTMDFAADVVVFPGGRVSADDYEGRPVASRVAIHEHVEAWSRTSIAEPGPGDLRAMCQVLLRAAQREVEEETGCRLEPADLVPWANWVTPPDLPKRFDTYFFVARVHQAAAMSHQTTEATASEWRSVRSLLGDYEDGVIRLMRPTIALLREVAATRGPDVPRPCAAVIVPQRPRQARPY